MRKDKKMKQMIVLVSSIALGIVLATLIIGFKSDANALVNTVTGELTALKGTL